MKNDFLEIRELNLELKHDEIKKRELLAIKCMQRFVVEHKGSELESPCHGAYFLNYEGKRCLMDCTGSITSFKLTPALAVEDIGSGCGCSVWFNYEPKSDTMVPSLK